MYLSGYNPIKMIKADAALAKSFYITSLARTTYAKAFNKKMLSLYYAKHAVYTQEKGNQLIYNELLGDIPFLFGRNGTNEMMIASEALFFDKGIIPKIKYEKYFNACNQCGFYYDNSEDWITFKELIIDSCGQIDMYGCFRMILEDYYITKFMKKDIIITHLNVLDFWNYEIPYTYALRGKKILVVHPLAELIMSQYEKRDKLFKNPFVLPAFQLQAIKAVQSIGGINLKPSEKWIEALEHMYAQIKDLDYDIALLGCGAYGMPLAAKIKRDGKKVIYMGGVLQMLFGIRGKRWDLHPKASQLYNNYWVSPNIEDRPAYFSDVENGCYW